MRALGRTLSRRPRSGGSGDWRDPWTAWTVEDAVWNDEWTDCSSGSEDTF